MQAKVVGTAVASTFAIGYGLPLESAATPSIPAACLSPKILQGAEIVMLDQHGGRGGPSGLDLGGARHPTHVVLVEAGVSGKPVVLIASAYEPTIWNVSAVPPSRLRAVVAYDFYPRR